MGVGKRKRSRRKTGPARMSERIESITTPVDRPPTAPEFGSGVLPPGISRYQRMSAHLPAGARGLRSTGILPVDAAIDLTADDPVVDLTD